MLQTSCLEPPQGCSTARVLALYGAPIVLAYTGMGKARRSLDDQMELPLLASLLLDRFHRSLQFLYCVKMDIRQWLSYPSILGDRATDRYVSVQHCHW